MAWLRPLPERLGAVTVQGGQLEIMIDLNNEAYHVPSLHRESLLPFLSDHCAVDTFGPHSRMCVPFKGLEKLADVPEADWPERLDTIMVTCIYPATVLIDHMQGGSMHRVSPGAHPGESTVHMIEGSPGPMDADARASCEEVMEANLSILDREGLRCHRRLPTWIYGGARSLVGGVGESLIGHWHSTWDLRSPPIRLINRANRTRTDNAPNSQDARLVSCCSSHALTCIFGWTNPSATTTSTQSHVALHGAW